MKCKYCIVPLIYDYQENCKLCGLFGWDNDDEHFKVYADGENDGLTVAEVKEKIRRNIEND